MITTTDPVANQLPQLLLSLSKLACQQDATYEVVVVDDLGFWQTFPEPTAAQYPGLALSLLTPTAWRGQQAAILLGIQQAKAPLILTIDPDLHPCVAEIPKMISLLSNKVWAVHGARSQRDDIGLLRRIGSHMANVMVQMITGLKVKDMGSPVTLLTRRALEEMRMPAGAAANPKIFGYIALGPALAVYTLTQGSVRHAPSQYSLISLTLLFAELLISSLKTRLAMQRRKEDLAP
ncbi:glycosyltransferase [Alcanivorax sp. 1008]|uniref:glycosyltransferase n=1 Tax=Alcanivorax sp. 1008 TaxID=2816853 RepID=UPI001E40C180|nr:glycosyltransferase [Alcanivorax sp. 1008]